MKPLHIMRQVLRDVGLKSELDRDAFLACARRVAAAGASLADHSTPAGERHQLLDTAGALARYFVANVSSLHSNNFYEGLGALAWVPATKVQKRGLQLTPIGLCGVDPETHRVVLCILMLPRFLMLLISRDSQRCRPKRPICYLPYTT